MSFTLDSKLLARQKWCWLRVPFYRRRRKRVEISIGEPFPEPVPKPVKHPKNIARFALDVRNYLVSNPGASYSDAAAHFKVTRPRISQLLRIANNLPADLLKQLAETNDPYLLKRYSGKRLLAIASSLTSSDKTSQNRHLISDTDLPLRVHTSKVPILEHDTPKMYVDNETISIHPPDNC